MFLDRYKFYGEYSDGYRTYMYGHTEEEAIQNLIDLMDKHEELIFYTGVNDEYYVDGEYCPETDRIYE